MNTLKDCVYIHYNMFVYIYIYHNAVYVHVTVLGLYDLVARGFANVYITGLCLGDNRFVYVG